MPRTPCTLDERISSYKRRYRRTLTDMLIMIQGELNGLDDEVFSPSSSIEGTAVRLIKESNRLQALLEVEDA